MATARWADRAAGDAGALQGMRLHAFDTGTMHVRFPRFREAMPSVFLGMPFQCDAPVQWPVYAWAIEHDDGVIVVDTGLTVECAASDYFPRVHPCFHDVRVEVDPDREIHRRLLDLGIDCLRDVRLVVLTSMFADRVAGIGHFPNSEVWVERHEYRRSAGILGLYRGYVSRVLPTWFDPRRVTLSKDPAGAFDRSLPLTADGRVALVPTPGRSPHEVSVRIDDGAVTCLLNGGSGVSVLPHTLLPDAVQDALR